MDPFLDPLLLLQEFCQPVENGFQGAGALTDLDHGLLKRREGARALGNGLRQGGSLADAVADSGQVSAVVSEFGRGNENFQGIRQRKPGPEERPDFPVEHRPRLDVQFVAPRLKCRGCLFSRGLDPFRENSASGQFLSRLFEIESLGQPAA